MARDQDLQQLRLGQVIPAAQPPPSWKQRQEAFDNYLRLIYGPGLLVGVRPFPSLCPGPGSSSHPRPNTATVPTCPRTCSPKGSPSRGYHDPHHRESPPRHVHPAQNCLLFWAGYRWQ